MRPIETMGDFIPLSGAGYPYITHPFATDLSRYCYRNKSVRLACLRHTASVSPGPGSNPPSETPHPEHASQFSKEQLIYKNNNKKIEFVKGEFLSIKESNPLLKTVKKP